jgi:hypothetical protein
MRRFFDKRATVVDVTNKEVIDLFQVVSTIVALLKTLAATAQVLSSGSRT